MGVKASIRGSEWSISAIRHQPGREENKVHRIMCVSYGFIRRWEWWVNFDYSRRIELHNLGIWPVMVLVVDLVVYSRVGTICWIWSYAGKTISSPWVAVPKESRYANFLEMFSSSEDRRIPFFPISFSIPRIITVMCQMTKTKQNQRENAHKQK